jgi:hypothetical protein
MNKIAVVIYFACTLNLFAQLRSFNEIFPNIGHDIRSAAFRDSGYYRINQKVNGIALLGSGQNSAIDPQIINRVLDQSPGYLVESIFVIPLRQGTVSLINVYNALGNIRGLNETPVTGNQASFVFRNATRIAGEKQTTAMPDPAQANILPRTETFFIRLNDINFGNIYFRAEMTLFQNGLRYTMSNFRNINFLFIPIIRKDNFIAQLYIEPITEGVLMYSIAGADIPDFLSSRINIDSAITKRLAVFISWAAGGIVNGNR